jgi:protocatechuate 3,4-dioxygenase beta subunit
VARYRRRVSRSSPVRPIDRVILFAALLACISFVVGLRDVATPVLVESAVTPPPPVEIAERDAALSVSVKGSEGLLLAGATVRVFWQRGDRYYAAGVAVTNAKGVATLEQLPRGAVWVIAEAAAHARASTQLVLESGERSVEVVLLPAHVLTVSVSDEAQAPIVRATVLVTASDPLPFGALTTADGSARFERLGPSPWTVKASAPGYESVTRSGVTSDLGLTLRRLGSLDVRVLTAAREPAAGAVVVIAGSSLWPARRVETDAQGMVRIGGLLGGSYDLLATKGDLVAEAPQGVTLEKGEHRTVELVLHPGRKVTALVTDGDEESARVVSGADVALAPGGLSSFPLHGRTGADGKVTLGPISSGPATLSARAPEFVAHAAVPVPETSTEPVRIALVRGATLKGEVVDARGGPVGGASIEVIGTDLQGLPVAETPVLQDFRAAHFEWALPGPVPLIPAGELGVMPGPVPPIPPAWAAPALGTGAIDPALAARAEASQSEPWVTRFDGRFTARPVTPGRVRALVRHPAFVEGISEPVTLGPGGEASVKVVLLAGGSLEGKIVDHLGRPVAGARVDLAAVAGTLERMSVTAADGSFAFAAVPARVVLSVGRPDELTTTALRETIEIGEGEKKVVELRLPLPRGTLRVVVKDEGGRPVDAAQVTVLSVDPKAPLRQTRFTGADGSVTVADAVGLAVRVLVEAPGWALSARQLAVAPELLEVRLERGVLVNGKITAVRGRRDVAGASVTLTAEGIRRSALSDSQGRFVLRDVAPGQARISVTHPDFAASEIGVEVKSTGRADRPFELDAIDLSESGAVEGEVVDEQGRPVLAARVAVGVVPAYLPAGALPAGMAVTDVRGRFRLSAVAPGNHVIQAHASGVGRGVARNIVVDSGRTASGIKIRLVRGLEPVEPASTGGVAVTLGERGSGPDLEIVVVHVAPGSEAERGGMRVGDVIEGVDGASPTSMGDARTRLGGPTGSDVVVSIGRGDRVVNLRIAREPVRR